MAVDQKKIAKTQPPRTAYLPIRNVSEKDLRNKEIVLPNNRIVSLYECSPVEFKAWFRSILERLIAYEQGQIVIRHEAKGKKTYKGTHDTSGSNLLKEVSAARVCDTTERFYLLSELSYIPAWAACEFPIFYVEE